MLLDFDRDNIKIILFFNWKAKEELRVEKIWDSLGYRVSISYRDMI